MSPAYDKSHAVTIVAAAPLAAHRIVSYDGNYATAAGGGKDAQGVTEHEAGQGQAVSAITGYSALVQCSEPLALWDWVKPAADGTGRAAKGTAADHCGRALCASAAADEPIEMQVLGHVHA